MPSHNDVAHAWANKTGKHTTGHNMFYSGDTIYSYGYHFPIAKHRILPQGTEIVFMTTKGYSISTSKHLGIVHGSITHLNTMLVANVGADSKKAHTDNYRIMLEERGDLLKKASRARVWRESYMNQADALRRRANLYTSLFKLGFHRIKALSDEELNGYLAKLTAKEAHWRGKRIRDMKKAKAKRRESALRQLEEWQAGQRVQCPYIEGLYDHVRIKNLNTYTTEGKERITTKTVTQIIQTSKGATVPLDQGLELFKLMKRCAENVIDWNPITVKKIGDFNISHIDENGTLHVACHTITLDAAIACAWAAGLEL